MEGAATIPAGPEGAPRLAVARRSGGWEGHEIPVV